MTAKWTDRSGRRGRAAGMLGCAVLLLSSTGCGSDGSTTSSRSDVERARAAVERAQGGVDTATAEFGTASAAFCSQSEGTIGVLDTYGRLLSDEAVTVGDLKGAQDDLASSRAGAAEAATDAVTANQELAEAQQALTDAEAELALAQAAEASGTSAPSTSTTAASTTTTPPLVPEEITDQVAAAEEALAGVAADVTDDTTVVDAGVRYSSAAFAVEVAWLRLYAAAGCLGDQKDAALARVADYTRALQAELTAAGFYDGPIDGSYGPETVAAIEALQEAAGLPVTGLVDPATEKALASRLTGAAGAALAGTATHTAAVQGALKVLGYWDGPVDGRSSDALTQAVAKLQADLGVEATGIVDAATLHALERALAAAKEPLDEDTTTTTEAVTTTTVASSTTTG